MLIQSKFPKSLWGYILLHMNYSKNCTYSKSVPNKTPFKIVHGSKPQLNNSCEWGGKVYVKILQSDKLKAQAKSTRWIEHTNLSNSHYIYQPDTHKASVERNILFSTKNEQKYALIIPTDEN